MKCLCGLEIHIHFLFPILSCVSSIGNHNQYLLFRLNSSNLLIPQQSENIIGQVGFTDNEILIMRLLKTLMFCLTWWRYCCEIHFCKGCLAGPRQGVPLRNYAMQQLWCEGYLEEGRGVRSWRRDRGRQTGAEPREQRRMW